MVKVSLWLVAFVGAMTVSDMTSDSILLAYIAPIAAVALIVFAMVAFHRWLSAPYLARQTKVRQPELKPHRRFFDLGASGSDGEGE